MTEPVVAPKGLVAVLCATGITVSLMHTLIAPLAPVLPEIFDTAPSDAYWAVTATLLAAAVVTPISGRLGDMFGKKRMMLVCLASLVVGSVMCAFAESIEVMVAGRAFQGAASGAIALGISILRDELPPERVGPAIALMSSSMGLGGAFGMPIAAAVADQADWHVLFWGSGGLALLCLALVVKRVPESPVRTPGRFDFVGALGLTTILIAVMVAITRGNDWGWASPTILGLLALAAVVLPFWGWHQLRGSEPLVDLRVSARPQVLFTNLASVAVGFGMYGSTLICTQLLMAPEESGYGLGLTMLQAGLVMAPGGFAMFLCSRLGAFITARRNARLALLVGIVVMVAAYVQGYFFHGSTAEVLLCNAVVSAGIGIAFAAMPSLIMGAVPVTETAAANGLNSLMRSLGTTSSAAVISAVLAASTVTVGVHVLPSAQSIERALLISLGAAVLALMLAVFIPRRSPESVEHGHRGVVSADARDSAAAARA